MENSERKLELKVGLFTLAGLLICGALLLYFGRIQEPFQPVYEITVHFPDASGLQKGAYVLMGGARIGRVGSPPEIPPDRDGVMVRMRVFAENRIPVGSTFRIRTSGLLGDAYVDVVPKKGEVTDGYYQDGQVIQGERDDGLDGLTASGTELLENLSQTNDELQKLLVKMNEEVLSKEFVGHIHNTAEGTSEFADVLREKAGPAMEDLQKGLENFNTASRNLVDLSEQLKGTAGKLDTNVDQVEGILRDVDAAVAQANSLLDAANSGDGPLPALLKDGGSREKLEGAIENLDAFSDNVRRHGLLFYRDSAAKRAAEAQAQEERPADVAPPAPESTRSRAISPPPRKQ